ncbi:ATP citrate lyase subunit 1, partial [Coemansia sp. S142-1]
MSAKAIREYDGKLLLAHYLQQSPTMAATQPTAAFAQPQTRLAQVNLSEVNTTDSDDKISAAVEAALSRAEQLNPWLASTKLVAKPDQLIKRRGKSGLLLLNADWAQVKEWIRERAVKEVAVGEISGVLKTFLVEPFVPHPADVEYYVCIQSHRDGDEILFTHEGGVEIGDVDAKALRLQVPIAQPLADSETIAAALLGDIGSATQRAALATFIERLYAVYVDLNFTYLEINPLVVLETGDGLPQVVYLDLAAKLDQTAEFESGDKWAKARSDAVVYGAASADAGPAMDFPAPFGRELSREEAYIQ